MMVSSACRSGARRAIVSSTNAAGTMMQMQRGGASAATNSSSEPEPVLPSPTSPVTASGLTSKTTQSWPLRIRRRTMLAPMRPSPIMPTCMRCSFPVRSRRGDATGYEGSSGDRTVTEACASGRRVPLRSTRSLEALVRSRHLVSLGRRRCWPSLVAAASASAASPSGVVISKLRLRTAASQFDEYVEIENTSSATVDLSGWQLFDCFTSGGTLARGHRRRSAGRGHEAARRADLRLRQERGRLHRHRRCDLQLPGHRGRRLPDQGRGRRHPGRGRRAGHGVRRGDRA